MKLLLAKRYALRGSGAQAGGDAAQESRFLLDMAATVQLTQNDHRISNLAITWAGCDAYQAGPGTVPTWAGALANARRRAGLSIHDFVREAADRAASK
jgi:hypothetical protein